MYDGTYDRTGTGRQADLERLRQAVETELARGPFCVGLRPPLRDGHRASTAAARTRELRLVCQLGCCLYLAAVLLGNLLMNAAPIWPDIALQCTLTPFVALSIAHIAFRPENAVLVREGAALAVAACFSLATLLAVCASPSPGAVLNLFVVSLAVIAVLFCVHLRFVAAVALVALSALTLWLVLLTRTDLPSDVRFYPLEFLLAVSAPGLFSVHRLERGARDLYLKALLRDVRIEQLAFENRLLNQLSATDALTGAANRRRLENALRKLCADPPGGDFLLLADIDFFKRFNDRHGHVAGDRCLRAVVDAIRRQVRRTDLVARFGGEEFAIVLPRTSYADALSMAERIRAGVAAQPMLVNGRPEHVTISIGIAGRSYAMTPAMLMALADSALYAAKAAGRNRVRCAPEVPTEAVA